MKSIRCAMRHVVFFPAFLAHARRDKSGRLLQTLGSVLLERHDKG